MKRILVFLFVLIILSSCGGTKKMSDFTYSWTPVYIDSSWDDIKDLSATKTIVKYEHKVSPLMEIIGYSTGEFNSKGPESPLSNFAVDVIREAAQNEFGCKVDVGLTNFGGIRSDLPAGAVRIYDIFSIFPFDNYVVMADIKGSQLRTIFEQMAKKGRVEALSNVEIVIDNFKLTKAYVDGAPIDDNRIYKLGTINFLLEGGDGIRIKKYSEKIYESKVCIRDAIVDHIKRMNAAGKKIDLKCDSRVIIKNSRRDSK